MLIRRSEGFNASPRNYTPQNEPDKRTIERSLRDAGMSRKEAKTFLAIGFDASAALYGWPVDDLRDASHNSKPQPDTLRDAVEAGPYIDTIESLMARIMKLT